jgi:PAS domain S-box-containing protein
MKKISTSKSQSVTKINLKESEKNSGSKHMEESLETERRFLRQVIDIVPAFICVKTEAGNYALANESLAKAYGTTVSGVEGKSDLDFSPTPEEAAAFRKDDLDVIHSRQTKTIAEEPITFEDGTVHWYSTTKIPVIDPDDSCSKVLVVAIDITEIREHRKNLQELVDRRTSEMKMSQVALVEAQAVAQMGSWEYDTIGDRIKGSEEFYRLFDIAPKDLIRISQFVERLHPDDRERVQCDIADALQQNRPYHTDYRVKLGDEGWRNINARGRVFTDTAGKTVSMVGTCLDITERKQDEEALRETKDDLEQRVLDRTIELARSKQLLEETGRLARVGGWEIDLKANSLYWSETTYKIHEVDPGFVPNVESGINFYAPEAIPVISQCVDKAIRLGEPFDVELELITAKKNRLWVRAIGEAYREEGQVVKVGGVFQDINTSKLAEIELKKYRDHLEEIVSERTKDLDKAIIDLKRSNQELEQFAYVASHDLQEPLRMVSSYTQLLERRYKDKLDQDAKDFITYAVDGANRMQRLINDLLEFSRVTTKGKPLVKLDLSDILGQAIANLHNKIQETGSMIVNDDLPFAYGDEGQLVRVFQNLLDNAMKFHDTETPRISVTSKVIDDKVQISISDNGIGIEKIYSERVFTIFQRLHTKADYPGTGIGLAICKRTIERHGGTIWFESESGKGTTFNFTLNTK